MIYLHVPFCRSFCTYCGFYSECAPQSPATDRLIDRWAAEVCREAEERRGEILASDEVNTLYIGGGTPSVLPPSVLRRLLEAIGTGPYDEFTLEVNPEDISEKGEEYLRELKALGVNRISMGIQSFDDGILRWMNRRHDAATAVRAFWMLREAGFQNLSIDLIFGIPGMSLKLWEESVKKALELRPEHISAYQLSVEEGSALDRRPGFREAPEEDCRQQYLLLSRMLAQAGYEHYEISNFALPGRQARHNSAYWQRSPYVGLGPGAHSLSADGLRRSWNSESVCGYGRDSEELSEEDLRVESLMLALRTAGGMDETRLKALARAGTAERLIASGRLRKTAEGRIRIPEEHFFISDGIIRELL